VVARPDVQGASERDKAVGLETTLKGLLGVLFGEGHGAAGEPGRGEDIQGWFITETTSS